LAVVRRYSWLTAVALAAAGCIALLPVTAGATGWPPWAAPRPQSLALRQPEPAPAAGQKAAPEAGPQVGPEAAREPLAGCEQKIKHGVPTLAIVGASFTAGVGPGNPGHAWAVLLARQLHWNAVVYGDPGAGYVRAGLGRKGRRGPIADEIARIGLGALKPELVIVQAGHDDIGVPPRLEERRVEQAVDLIRAEAPRAQIALLTVFAGRSRSAAAYRAAHRTDSAIVAGGIAADRGVIIMDPLTGGWTFPRSRDGLHPSAAGSVWIAAKVAGILREHGVLAQPAGRGAVVCDVGIAVPRQREAD
jgi:lysophospholipase L1-like esterase